LSDKLFGPVFNYNTAYFERLSLITLGIESSCDETGIALYQMGRGLLSHALHTQIAMHSEYGGVVPELASRDHVQRVIPLIRQVMREADVSLGQLDAIAYTQGPGLGGALLVGASVANSLARYTDYRHSSSGRPPALPAAVRPGTRISFCRLTGIGRTYATDARGWRGAI
jgi:hypothetical protein